MNKNLVGGEGKSESERMLRNSPCYSSSSFSTSTHWLLLSKGKNHEWKLNSFILFYSCSSSAHFYYPTVLCTISLVLLHTYYTATRRSTTTTNTAPVLLRPCVPVGINKSSSSRQRGESAIGFNSPFILLPTLFYVPGNKSFSPGAGEEKVQSTWPYHVMCGWVSVACKTEVEVPQIPSSQGAGQRLSLYPRQWRLIAHYGPAMSSSSSSPSWLSGPMSKISISCNGKT